MECKSYGMNAFNKMTAGINRYIMECKSCSVRFLYQTLLELIDTLWNVNKDFLNF